MERQPSSSLMEIGPIKWPSYPRVQPADPSTIQDVYSNEGALQQMYELESLNWMGGDMHWDGPHNKYCEVCGGETELFGCQTCNTSQHAACMSPTLEADEVPSFWFCPHCVDHSFHIPQTTTSTTSFQPQIPLENSQPQIDGFTPMSNDSTSVALSNVTLNGQYPTPPNTTLPITSSNAAATNQTSPLAVQDLHVNTSSESKPKSGISSASNLQTPTSHPSAEEHQPPKRGRPRRGASPVKKKSKYSSFSSEVDKALTVIHAELEAAAKNGRSESHLHEQIRSLEQQLKLQDGQVILLRRELEAAKHWLEIEKFKVGRLQGVMKTPSEEVVELKKQLAMKDAELHDWRNKLSSLFGSREVISAGLSGSMYGEQSQ